MEVSGASHHSEATLLYQERGGRKGGSFRAAGSSICLLQFEEMHTISQVVTETSLPLLRCIKSSLRVHWVHWKLCPEQWRTLRRLPECHFQWPQSTRSLSHTSEVVQKSPSQPGKGCASPQMKHKRLYCSVGCFLCSSFTSEEKQRRQHIEVSVVMM